MKRWLLAVLVAVCMISVVYTAGGATGLRSMLPPGAEVRVTAEADLTGDGRPELIVGYVLARNGQPPTIGHAAVFEPDGSGGYRRFDLPGAWPGHYDPRFRVLDLTGDGRPTLVEEAGSGGAWGTLRVFRRAADAYEMLLQDDAQSHVLWDADGDGRPEIFARYRAGSQADQALQRFSWKAGRFVAWHAPEWVYPNGPGDGPEVPNILGLELQQAENVLSKARLNLGVIAELDVPGKSGQIIRYERDHSQVHVVVRARNIDFAASILPSVESVYYRSDDAPGAAPVATTASQRALWHKWLRRLADGALEAVYTRLLQPPAYIVRLDKTWSVKLGGKTEHVRWVGVGMAPPHAGLLYLAAEDPRPGELWPPFKAAVYTIGEIAPEPVPAERPITEYLKQYTEVDAFVTIWPQEWDHAVRLRGISFHGWPEALQAPHLEGPASPERHFVPNPDHATITVLNGFVQRAERNGDFVYVDIVSAPGRVHRWRLSLTGFNRSTELVRVRMSLPGQAPTTRTIPLHAWILKPGRPAPDSSRGRSETVTRLGLSHLLSRSPGAKRLQKTQCRKRSSRSFGISGRCVTLLRFDPGSTASSSMPQSDCPEMHQCTVNENTRLFRFYDLLPAPHSESSLVLLF